MAAVRNEALVALQSERYISLETFKRNGTGVKTPIWFAEHGGGLYIYTSGKAWKVKRLRRNPDCKIAACDFKGKVTGTWFDGRATELSGADAKVAYRHLLAKYGLQMRVTDVGAFVSGRTKERVFYRIDV